MKFFAPDNGTGVVQQTWLNRFLSGPFLFEKYERSLDKKTSAMFQNRFLQNMIANQRFLLMEAEELKALITTYHTETPIPQKTIREADAAVLGETFESANGIEIAVRVVDAMTSVILGTFDVFAGENTPESITAIAERLSAKIHRAFPMLDGTVRSVDGSDCDAEFADRKPTDNWPMLIYEFEDPSRESDCVFAGGTDTRMIADAEMKKKIVRILGETNRIRPGHRIITR